MAIDAHGIPVDFARRSIEPAAWFTVGYSVYVSAIALWKPLKPALEAYEKGTTTAEDELSLRMRGPFAMLAGLAIEDMLKGAILHRTPKKDRKPWQTHNLVVLSKALSLRSDITWSDDESDLLERLTTFVRWAGRYPVALTDKETQEPRILKTADYLTITQIAGRLADLYQKGQ